MTVAQLWVIFKGIGAVVGIILTLITFFGIVSKRPMKALRKLIREESDNANKELKDSINFLQTTARERFDQIDKKFSEVEGTNDDMLRNTLTHIYFKYKDEKKIPHYEKENVLHLAARYKGNTYVHSIVDEMKTWDEII